MIDDIDGEASGEFLVGLVEQEGAFIGTAGAENEWKDERGSWPDDGGS